MKISLIDKELINRQVVDSTPVNLKIYLVDDICKCSLKFRVGSTIKK